MSRSISIVIPAYNEAGNIESAVRNVLDAIGTGFDAYEIIVVNDASTDSTAAILNRLSSENAHIKVIHHSTNKGMGSSLQDGFEQATQEFIGSFPGDNGLVPGSLELMFEQLGKADVIGYYIANPEFRPLYRRVISKSFVMMINLLFGLNHRYYNGHAIYKAPFVKNLRVLSSGHSFLPEVLIRLLKQKKATYLEIGTIQQERQFGKTKAFSILNVRSVLAIMLKLAWEIRFSK